jgi:hypothetical protein
MGSACDRGNSCVVIDGLKRKVFYSMVGRRLRFLYSRSQPPVDAKPDSGP